MEQCLQVEGPASHRVYQRNGEGTADISYTLLLQGATSGEIMQRLERSTEQTPWLSAGTITGSNVLRGIIGDVPTGEWTIHFRIVGEADTGFASETTVGPIFVGDLWLLAGQSNMEGCGYLADLEEPLNGVSCFYLGDRWDIAADPLTWLKESVDPVNWGDVMPEAREAAALEERRMRVKGAGLGIAFGKELLRQTGVPVGLVMCAHGGTSMEQWDPARKTEGGNSLYGALLRRVRAVGGKVAGCLWYQGESDANERSAPGYAERLDELLRQLRHDLNDARLPFLYAQLSRFHTWEKGAVWWNRIQDEQLRFEGKDPYIGMVPAIDAALSDPIHLDALSLRRIGRRFAARALAMVHGIPSGRGPRLSGYEWNDGRTILYLHLDKTALNGQLRPVERIYGFHVEAEEMVLVPQASLSAEKTGIVLEFDRSVPAGALLFHGSGYHPHVNTADETGIPLPVFGPLHV